ncbi:hypothetical protein ACHAQA_007407 [Verticillium albo-atrum]
MPPKAATPASEGDTLSTNEVNFIKTMFDNMTTKPDADWEQMAKSLGLANGKCAKERFRQISKKHNWGVGESGTSPAKSTNKTAAAAAGPLKPSKVAKSTPKKKTPVKKKIARADTPEPEEPVLESDTEEKPPAVLNSDADSDFEV